MGGGDSMLHMNERRPGAIARQEGRQLAGRHHEIHHGGDDADDGKQVGNHFHWLFSLIGKPAHSMPPLS